MILYLTNAKTTNLLDFLLEQKEAYPLHKIEGNIDMKNFVIRDMANYSHFAEIVINKEIVVNDDKTFVHAIEEFHTMYDARITVICEELEETSSLFKALLSIGVGNIITSSNLVEIQRDIVSCLSVSGLNRYEASERVKPKPKHEHYNFKCSNVRIGVVGSQSRIGTTTFALGLVNWLGKVGATACYIEANKSNILSYIAKEYGLAGVKESFEVDSMQFSKAAPEQPCNFEVYDFGSLNEKIISNLEYMQEVVLTCGVKIYELPYTALSLKELRETSIYVSPTFFAEETMERYENVFANEMHEVLQPVYQPDFMNSELARVNYKKMIEKYIAAE